MLVVTEFEINKEADTFLTIVGRQSGIISKLLSMVGISPITELRCSRDEVLYRASSMRRGNITIGIPNTAVTAVGTGYTKPFGLLVTAFVLFLVALYGLITIVSGGGSTGTHMLCFGLIGVIISLVMYHLGKVTIFAVYAGGDKPIVSLEVKRSVIERKRITEEDWKEGAALIRKAVIHTQKHHD